jgi:uncharacterized protein YegL
MAYVKKQLNKDNWSLIANNVTVVTFQNSSQYPFYVNFTSAANTAPTDVFGLVYGPWQGELKKTVTEMTSVATPTHVWAKSISTNGAVIVEE